MVGGIADADRTPAVEAFILSENKKWGEIVRISGAAPD